MRFTDFIIPAIRILGISYLAALSCLYFFQRHFIYYPTRIPPAQLPKQPSLNNLQAWQDSTGEISGWHKPIKTAPDTPIALVFHGNAGCALDRVYFVEGLSGLEPVWETFLFEYPGYGARSGRPSERLILNAAEQALLSLQSFNRPIFLLGESLGTGVAAGLAERHPKLIAGILLITPFTSLADVGQSRYPVFPVRWLLRERYDSLKALRNYHGPVAFMLAEKDEVVSFKLGKKLYESYSGPKRLWQQNAGHNTLNLAPYMPWWSEAAEFLLHPSE